MHVQTHYLLCMTLFLKLDYVGQLTNFGCNVQVAVQWNENVCTRQTI